VRPYRSPDLSIAGIARHELGAAHHHLLSLVDASGPEYSISPVTIAD
jgi:hypothetical protein